MKKTNFTSKHRLLVMLALLIAVVMIAVVFTGCKGKGGDGDETGELSGDNAIYTVTLTRSGGSAVPELDVYVYENDSLEDMVELAKTDENGEVSFNIPESDKYAIVISNAPKGYVVEESYSFDGKKADIELETALVTDEDISTAQLGLGDVMYDFTIMKPDESEITLSEVLKEKDMVLLNFWYTTCSWCVEEFPIMNEVYDQYKDKIEIIAVDPMDDSKAVEGFQAQYGLNFPMASCPSSWSNTFSISGYPTSIIIDRYGVICVVEAGAITSKRPFVSAFDHFTAEDYEQKICENGIFDLVTQVKPSYTMDTSENIAAQINSGDITVSYRPEEGESAEFTWPFIATEKSGRTAIYASNKEIDDSYAIIYADVTLKAGQALGFDYYISSERLCDILYVIVDDEDIFQISGTSETEEWKSCYPVVADKDGTYEVALCYLKDSDGSEGEDTVYIDNMRVIDASAIDTQTYLPRQAAVYDEKNDSYSYATVVLNEADGYYHVGTADGPLLLADLMNYTQFNEEQTVQDVVMAGDADKDGVSLYDKTEDGGANMVKYFSYASNASITGICTVNRELGEMLKQVAEVAGYTGEENEWLTMCKYYQSYGPGATQLQDPIKGLSPTSAFEAKLGKDISTNNFYYDRAIIPRGLFAEFVPDKSGVYRFTSKSDYAEGIDAWIFDENSQVLLEYEHDERMYTDEINCSMVYYMEAGKKYYINMAFWDIYATGYIYYDVEYEGESIQLFRACAPGYFTYDTNATGDAMYGIITEGITPVLKDGKYYDAEDGSLIYCDFTGLTSIFGHSIVEMIEMNGFDFSKSETDGEIVAYLNQNNGDVEKTDEYLKKLWGEDYDENADIYQIDDIFQGRFHGDGPDLTEEIRTYVAKMDKSGTEKDGCVVVDERLAEILQLLMDKYTFENVENAWIKVCYYYDYLGSAK